MSDDDDDDDEKWAHRSTPAARTTASSLRAQLGTIADTWERTKLTEQQTLNRRITTLTATNRTLLTEKGQAKTEVKELEAKLEAKGQEVLVLEDKVGGLETGAGSFNKRLLGLQFILAELVAQWPQLPVYAPPPEGALVVGGGGDSGGDDSGDDSDSDSSAWDSDEDEDGGGSSTLELEGGGTSGKSNEEGDDHDEDEGEEDMEEGGEGAKKKKKKKRGKRGGKKKKGLGPGSDSPDKQNLALEEDEASWEELSAAAAADGLTLPPPPLQAAASAAKQKRKSGGSSGERRRHRKSPNKKKQRKPRYLLPVVSHTERAPFPADLSCVPSSEDLVTREAFLGLTGGAGLTRKQLNTLETLLGGDGAGSGSGGGGWLSSNNEEELLGMVDEALGGGLNACCGANGSLRIAKLLLAAGANPSYMGQQFDASPVHRAIQFGHDHVFSLLLTHKVNINATDPHLGRTPLHFAAQYNRPTLAKLLVQKGAMVDSVDNAGETATDIAAKLKWKKVSAILTDPSVLFWNFANRANKLYKAMEFDLAIVVYEKSFAVLGDVKPSPSNQNKATLHYNCARAAANLGRHVPALSYCATALELVPSYASALEQRAKCHVALFNYKLAVDDLETLVAGVTAAEPGNLDSWLRLKRDAKQKLDQTHFSLLGLPANGAGVSSADVKKAYRTQCILWHPDKHVQSEEAKHRAHGMFQRVNEANEVLSDPLKKQQYEYKLRFSSPRTPSSSAGFGGFGGTTTSSPSPYGRGAAGRGGYGQRSSPTGKWNYNKKTSGFEDSDDDDDDEDGNL